MSRYQQMVEAAKTAHRKYSEYEQRSRNNLVALRDALVNHCGVPEGHISYQKWNGLRGDEYDCSRSDTPGSSFGFNIAGATVYDELEGQWHLVIRIKLTLQVEPSEPSVTFHLILGEVDRKTTVQLGFEGMPKNVDFRSEDEIDGYCDVIVERILEAYGNPIGQPARKLLGFQVT